MSLPNATPGTLQCPPVSPRTFWPQVAAAPELSHGGGGWVSPRCPHGAGPSLTGHLHLGLALQQRSHAVADDAAVEAGVGAVQRGDHVPAGGVSALRGHPCHCHSPSERLQVLHTLPVYRTRAQSSFSLRSCCWRCTATQAGDTPVSLTATQGLTATRTGGTSTVPKPVTVTLPLQGLDVTHGHEPGPWSRCREPCPSPTVTLRSAGVAQPGAESGQIQLCSDESRLNPLITPSLLLSAASASSQ